MTPADLLRPLTMLRVPVALRRRSRSLTARPADTAARLRTSLALALALSLGALPALALDTVTYADQEGGNFTIIPQIGIAKGYFKAEGIELRRVVTQRSNDSIEAALAGKVDVGSSGGPPVVAATSRGAPIMVVGMLGYGFTGSLVASKSIPNLTRLEDFRGKRIGTLIGSGVMLVYQMAIAQSGLKETDFRFSNLRVPDMPAAMQTGSFEAVIGWGSGLKRIIDAGYGYLAIRPTDIERIAHVTYPTLVFATRTFIKNKPDAMQRFMRAWVKSQQFAQSNQDEALKIVRNALGDRIAAMSDEDLRDVVYNQQYGRAALNQADFQDLAETRDFMLSRKMIDQKLDIATLVDNSFAEAAQGAAAK